MSPSSTVKQTQEIPAAAAAVVDHITDGFTANESVPETDTGTATRGSAADAVVGGEPVGDLAAKSNAAVANRHRDPDVEPPRVSKDQKPDITAESAPADTSARKTAPTLDTDQVPPNDEKPA